MTFRGAAETIYVKRGQVADLSRGRARAKRAGRSRAPQPIGTGGYAGATPYARLAQDVGDGFLIAWRPPFEQPSKYDCFTASPKYAAASAFAAVATE
jgi:hypothetical protein